MKSFLFLLGGVILLFFAERLIKSLPKMNLWARWLLFFPASLMRPLAFSMITLALCLQLFPTNEYVHILIVWTVSPILIISTVSKTIPKGSRKITTIFCALWIAGGVYDVIMRGEHYKARIIQITGIALYLFWQNYTRRFMPTKEKKQHEEEEL